MKDLQSVAVAVHATIAQTHTLQQHHPMPFIRRSQTRGPHFLSQSQSPNIFCPFHALLGRILTHEDHECHHPNNPRGLHARQPHTIRAPTKQPLTQPRTTTNSHKPSQTTARSISTFHTNPSPPMSQFYFPINNGSSDCNSDAGSSSNPRAIFGSAVFPSHSPAHSPHVVQPCPPSF